MKKILIVEDDKESSLVTANTNVTQEVRVAFALYLALTFF